MNFYEKHIKEVKQIANGFSICNCLDFYGENMLYYGLYHNHIYTEGFKSLTELGAEHPELIKLIPRNQRPKEHKSTRAQEPEETVYQFKFLK